MSNAIEPALPESLTIIDHGTYVEIVRRWFGPMTLAMTVFVLDWNGFLAAWYGAATEGGGLVELLFPIGHVGVGVGLTYWVVAGWINKTRIMIGDGLVGVRHGPIPWFGNRDFELADLAQVYVIERTHTSKNGTSTSYELRAMTKAGRDVKLASGFKRSEEALYLEHLIEKHAGIVDRPVKGAKQ